MEKEKNVWFNHIESKRNEVRKERHELLVAPLHGLLYKYKDKVFRKGLVLSIC